MWSMKHRERGPQLVSGCISEANSEKGWETIEALTRRGRETPALPLRVRVGHSSTCRLTATQAIMTPHRAAICFIINHCLANKGRVQLKNTRNSKAGGISRTMMGPQPLAMTINILLAARLTATALPAPLLVADSRPFPPGSSAPPARYGKTMKCACKLTDTLANPVSHPAYSCPYLVWIPKDQKRGDFKAENHKRSQFGA